uniref:Uncharacterized protein n=1 Tax=Amphimedon queenslandica TaxID=400682 RepID=A0A1X7UWY5_AMPQE
MVGPRSYTVNTSTGTIRRNRRHLNQLPPILDENDHPSEEEKRNPSSDLSDTPEKPHRRSLPSKQPDWYGNWTHYVT